MTLLSKFIESQFFVALCFTGLSFYFQKLLGFFNINLLIIGGIGTFAMYLFSVTELKNVSKSKAIYFFGLIGLLIVLSVFVLSIKTIIGMAFLFLITLAYKIPIFGIKLREIPFLKIFQIAFVWSSLIYLIPMIEEKHLSFNWMNLLSLFSFIFGITLPFDFNDIEADQNKLLTVPMLIGEKRTKYLSVFALFLSLILFINSTYKIDFQLSWSTTIMIAIGLCLNISTTKSNFYYRFWIESLSLIPFLLLLIINVVKQFI